MSLQEKFQISIPFKERKESLEEWASFESQRTTQGNPKPGHGEKFNMMPPGMDIENQGSREEFKYGFGGNLDVGGKAVNAKALGGVGFTRYDMKGTDDQYTGEHMDLFYGKAVDEKGNEGFAERNNYVDRL